MNNSIYASVRFRMCVDNSKAQIKRADSVVPCTTSEEALEEIINANYESIDDDITSSADKIADFENDHAKWESEYSRLWSEKRAEIIEHGYEDGNGHRYYIKQEYDCDSIVRALGEVYVSDDFGTITVIASAGDEIYDNDDLCEYWSKYGDGGAEEVTRASWDTIGDYLHIYGDQPDDLNEIVRWGLANIHDCPIAEKILNDCKAALSSIS